MPVIIAVSGPTGVGKNFFSYLCAQHPVKKYPRVEEYAIGDSVKYIIADIISLLHRSNISRVCQRILILYPLILAATIIHSLYSGIWDIYAIVICVILASIIAYLDLYICATPDMHTISRSATDILCKYLGNQVFILALVNRIVASNADVIIITDCAAEEFPQLKRWLPVLFGCKKYTLIQVYINRTSPDIDEQNTPKVTYAELDPECHRIDNDGTTMGFWHVTEKWWHNTIMPIVNANKL